MVMLRCWKRVKYAAGRRVWNVLAASAPPFLPITQKIAEFLDMQFAQFLPINTATTHTASEPDTANRSDNKCY